MDNCICSDELTSELSFKEFEVALNSLKRNKAIGADEINGNVIIDCFDILKHVLFKVFKASINQEIFPEQLKVAKITPIFKEGDRSNISNYRSISVLSYMVILFKRTKYLFCRLNASSNMVYSTGIMQKGKGVFLAFSKCLSQLNGRGRFFQKSKATAAHQVKKCAPCIEAVFLS
nr:uncharacterized protein LOC124806174 [Hydra vulgaris]